MDTCYEKRLLSLKSNFLSLSLNETFEKLPILKEL